MYEAALTAKAIPSAVHKTAYFSQTASFYNAKRGKVPRQSHFSHSLFSCLDLVHFFICKSGYLFHGLCFVCVH